MTCTIMPEKQTAVFWDWENCPLPAEVSPAAAAKAIQSAVSEHIDGSRIEMRRVYFDPLKAQQRPRDPSGLDSSGFDLVHTPTRNMKETLDKKLIADVLTFAWDCSSGGGKPCVVLITSDGDYAYTLAKLQDRCVFNVVMYGPQCQTANILLQNAKVALSFRDEVLKLAKTPPPVITAPDTGTTTSTTITTNTPLPPASTANNRESMRKTNSFRSSGSGGSRGLLSQDAEDRDASLTQSISNDDMERDVVAYCFHLYDRQKKWEVGTRIPYEKALIPSEIMQGKGSFKAPSSTSAQAKKDARDNAISVGYVETFRKDQNGRFVSSPLGGGMRPGQSLQFSLRLTETGRSFVEKVQRQRVVDYCTFLYQKQKGWERGNRVRFDLCWIPFTIVKKDFSPSPRYPTRDFLEYIRLCKDTRDYAISLGFVETARQDTRSKEYVPVKIGEKAQTEAQIDGLSKEFFVRLTSGGRQLVENLGVLNSAS